MNQTLLSFQPGRMGDLYLKNRLVRSATAESTNTRTGEVTDATIELYRRLAEGGAGLIITGHAAACEKGLASPDMTRIHDNAHINGIRKIARAVHETDPECRVILQLNHPGRQISRESPSEPVAPSSILSNRVKALGYTPPRSLLLEEVETIIDDFVAAITRAQEAEFDGVQLHAAHGWLLSSFLSPQLNVRDDRFGGTPANRARILTEIISGARRSVGDTFPILVKINSDDLLPEGLKPADAAQTAVIIERAGCTAIEVSGGTWEALILSEAELGFKPVPIPEARTEIKTLAQEAYFNKNIPTIRAEVSTPLILVGGIKSRVTVENILAQGLVDFCALCRPLIRQPNLPNLWENGTGKGRATCRSCNDCLYAKPRKCVHP